MNSRTYILNAVIVFLSIFIVSSTFASHLQDQYTTFDLKNQRPLTIRTIGGRDLEISFIKHRATIKELKDQVAQMWNKEFDTDYTAHQIALGAGSDWLAETRSNQQLYEDTDVLSHAAIYASHSRLMYLIIKEKYLTATQENPCPLTIRSMNKTDYPIHFLTRGDTIGYLKEQVAQMRDEKFGTTTSAIQIRFMRCEDWLTDTHSDDYVYQDTDVLSRDAIHNSKARSIWMFIYPKT